MSSIQIFTPKVDFLNVWFEFDLWYLFDSSHGDFLVVPLK